MTRWVKVVVLGRGHIGNSENAFVVQKFSISFLHLHGHIAGTAWKPELEKQIYQLSKEYYMLFVVRVLVLGCTCHIGNCMITIHGKYLFFFFLEIFFSTTPWVQVIIHNVCWLINNQFRYLYIHVGFIMHNLKKYEGTGSVN